MTFASVQTTLETYFKNNWSHTSIEFENDSLDTTSVDEFVRFSIQFGDGKSMALGNKEFRYPAVLFVQIFNRPAVGNARLMILADLVSALFRTTLALLPIRFEVPVILKIPKIDAGFIQTQVSCSFYFEEISP